jgi:hypothetical protein
LLRPRQGMLRFVTDIARWKILFFRAKIDGRPREGSHAIYMFKISDSFPIAKRAGGFHLFDRIS